MEITVQTTYNQKALAAMTRALRKTVRQKQSQRSKIAAIVVLVLGLIFAVSASEINLNFFLNLLANVVVAAALIWQDQISGYVARKRMLPGMTTSTTTFSEDGYHSVTAVGESDFTYKNIFAIAEDADYFVLIFSSSHAQIYSKAGISGGDFQALAKLLRKKTNLTIQQF